MYFTHCRCNTPVYLQLTLIKNSVKTIKWSYSLFAQTTSLSWVLSLSFLLFVFFVLCNMLMLMQCFKNTCDRWRKVCHEWGNAKIQKPIWERQTNYHIWGMCTTHYDGYDDMKLTIHKQIRLLAPSIGS